MASFAPVRALFIVVGLLLLGLELWVIRRNRPASKVQSVVLAGWGLANVALVIFFWVNQTPFPLNLDLMEGTVLQHFQRASFGQPIYSVPSADFAALAYNPLYYVVSIPFGWVLGVNLTTLRIVSILATIGSAAVLYVVVRQKTGSVWWGVMAVGLFAAAYRVMDAYLNTAHSDAWFLFSALLGTAIIDRNRSRGWNAVGVVVLVACFWFKQHGAFFAIGGLLYLTWREGFRATIYWLIALLLGPALYLFVGPLIFGPDLQYYTWEVPRRWSEFNLGLLRRFLLFIAGNYAVLALSSAVYTAWTFVKQRKAFSVWQFQFAFALLSAALGTLDPGSSDNVYIPMGTWFILLGVLGLAAFARNVSWAARYRVHLVALVVTFALFLYNPADYVVPANASAEFDTFTQTLASLDGTVYAPWLGQLQRGYVFSPAVHWVALDDMVRGPGRNTENNPLIRDLLAPVEHPPGNAYIVTNYPLESFPLLRFLTEDYVLDTDWGDTFASLSVLPKRFYHAYPRYLYRYDPQAAAAAQGASNG